MQKTRLCTGANALSPHRPKTSVHHWLQNLTPNHLKIKNLCRWNYWLYLPTGEPHSVNGIENASLLVTVLLPKQ